MGSDPPSPSDVVKTKPSQPLYDPGAPPGDPTNTTASALIANAATAEATRLSGKGLASTYVNGAGGVKTQPVSVKTLMKVA